MKKQIRTLKDMIELQAQPGNWDFDPYMHGMLNGMIFALSIFDGKEPKYKDAPKKWHALKPKKRIFSCSKS